jgi:hypothetical protein
MHDWGCSPVYAYTSDAPLSRGRRYAKIRRQDRRMQLPALYMPLTFWCDGYPCVQIGFLCYVPLIHAVPR